MRFRSDQHRKAVFANLFNKKERKTKVNSFSVNNFEVKSTKVKSQSHKPLKFSYHQVKLKDVKTKGEKEFCNMCKRKGLSLKKGKCNECEKERKEFKTELEDKIEKIPKRIENAKSFSELDPILDEIRKIGDKEIENNLRENNYKKKADELLEATYNEIKDDLRRDLSNETDIKKIYKVFIPHSNRYRRTLKLADGYHPPYYNDRLLMGDLEKRGEEIIKEEERNIKTFSDLLKFKKLLNWEYTGSYVGQRFLWQMQDKTNKKIKKLQSVNIDYESI